MPSGREGTIGVITMLVAAAIIFLMVTSCGKEPGPAGPRGEQGLPGQDGLNGLDAETPPYAVVEIVDPCGDAPGVIDEVLLKLANGQVLASFSENSSGKNTRFALVPAGTYQTTDGTGCVFNVSNNGSITF